MLDVGSIFQYGEDAMLELFDTRPEATKRLLIPLDGAINGLHYEALGVTQAPKAGDVIGRYIAGAETGRIIVSSVSASSIETNIGLSIGYESSSYSAGRSIFVILNPRLGTE